MVLPQWPLAELHCGGEEYPQRLASEGILSHFCQITSPFAGLNHQARMYEEPNPKRLMAESYLSHNLRADKKKMCRNCKHCEQGFLHHKRRSRTMLLCPYFPAYSRLLTALQDVLDGLAEKGHSTMKTAFDPMKSPASVTEVIKVSLCAFQSVCMHIYCFSKRVSNLSKKINFRQVDTPSEQKFALPHLPGWCLFLFIHRVFNCHPMPKLTLIWQLWIRTGSKSFCSEIKKNGQYCLSSPKICLSSAGKPPTLSEKYMPNFFSFG